MPANYTISKCVLRDVIPMSMLLLCEPLPIRKDEGMNWKSFRTLLTWSVISYIRHVSF